MDLRGVPGSNFDRWMRRPASRRQHPSTNSRTFRGTRAGPNARANASALAARRAATAHALNSLHSWNVHSGRHSLLVRRPV